MSAIRSRKIEITMPKLAGNSIRASTTTAPPPSQRIVSLTHCHLKVANEVSPHQASAIRAICRTSDSSSDCHSTPRNLGSVSWPKPSSKALITKAPLLGADDAGRLELADLPGREAALAQHLVGVLAALGGRAL